MTVFLLVYIIFPPPFWIFFFFVVVVVVVVVLSFGWASQCCFLTVQRADHKYCIVFKLQE